MSERCKKEVTFSEVLFAIQLNQNLIYPLGAFGTKNLPQTNNVLHTPINSAQPPPTNGTQKKERYFVTIVIFEGKK
jgi:hypothetical protein